MTFPKHKYDECPHCDVSHAGEHHTQCPNYTVAPTLCINVVGWEMCVTAYLYPESWGVWLDRPPIPLTLPRPEMWDDLETL